jgi:transposase
MYIVVGAKISRRLVFINKDVEMLGQDDPKVLHLQNFGALNPRAQAVTDPLFVESDFFDPRDLVLVKYEMLRCVRVDGVPATESAQRFGFSRAGFYKTLSAFQRQGMTGLIPSTPGPRGAHKLSDAILQFIDAQFLAHGKLSSEVLAVLIHNHFNLSVHPRSIERALLRREKKR